MSWERKLWASSAPVLLMLCFATPVTAASEPKWIILDTGVNTKTVIDEASIVSVGRNRQARNARFNEDGSVVLVYQYYKCESREVRLAQFFEHAEDGSLKEIPLPKGGERWIPVPPNSTMERLFEFVCAHKL